MIKCNICGLEFANIKDLQSHLWKLDSKHEDAMEAFHEDGLDRHNGDCLWCGGLIRTYSGNNEDSWSTECTRCGWLYDED